jgi:DNA repair exonuclease SbcCD ATPase subunit
MQYVDPIKYSKSIKQINEVEEMKIPHDGHKKMSLSEKVKSLSPEKQEELKQYVDTIKEVKKKINEMLNSSEKVEETGGNMSSGLYLSPEE